MHNTVVRAYSLYFTVHDPTNKLKIGPIRKIDKATVFYFLLRHAMKLFSNHTFSGK